MVSVMSTHSKRGATELGLAILLSSINRSSKNFEVRRAFTAHQLFTILKEVSHMVLLL
jgi:hypothetical protein